MTYKCLECGNIFDDVEVKEWTEEHGEHMNGCPVCGSAYEETVRCAECHCEYLDEELFDGICLECLRESIYYDLALEYLMDGDALIALMAKFYECDDLDSVKPSEKFTAALRENYLRMKANDLLLNKTEFINCIREFILEDDGDYGKLDYAEWLNRKEEK